MKKNQKNHVIATPKMEKGCFGSFITIWLTCSIILLIGIFILDYDRATGRLFGWESKTYFVVEKYGYPYKLLKKKPGYQYKIENGEIVKIIIKGYSVDSVKKQDTSFKYESKESFHFNSSEKNSANDNTSKPESKIKICSKCKGAGETICYTCNGTAIQNCPNHRGIDCYTCKGSGITKCYSCLGGKKECSWCRGTGKDI